MKAITHSQHAWNEIIFRNRNKAYGAYDLTEPVKPIENLPASNSGVVGTAVNDANDDLPLAASIPAPPVFETFKLQNQPEFPGGINAFYKYLMDRIRYGNTDVEGILYISFI